MTTESTRKMTYREGHVYEVNGKGAEPVEGYPLTRFELQVLARHWAREELDISIFGFLYATTGSTEIRLKPHAQDRLRRIAELVGEEEVAKEEKQVQDAMRERIGDDYWRVFCAT